MDKDGCVSGGLWNFPHIFIFKMWLFQFINGINFRWYYVMLCIVDIMVWIIILKNGEYIGFLQTHSTSFSRRTYPQYQDMP